MVTCALAGVAVEALAAVGRVGQGVLAAVLVARVLHLGRGDIIGNRHYRFFSWEK